MHKGFQSLDVRTVLLSGFKTKHSESHSGSVFKDTDKATHFRGNFIESNFRKQGMNASKSNHNGHIDI